MKAQSGFTLAETLITLAIIGVVSALVIPTVITNYQKKQTAVKLKKVYSTLQQVLIQSETENGPHKNWDYTLNSVDFYNKYFKKYFQPVKETTATLGVRYYLKSNGTIMSSSDFPITYSGHPKIILGDGTIMSFGIYNSSNFTIQTDINGLKKPNTLGNDVFTFQVLSYTTSITPQGYGTGRSRDEIKNNSNFGCNKSSTYGRQWCPALIMKDGWEISSDYPW